MDHRIRELGSKLFAALQECMGKVTITRGIFRGPARPLTSYETLLRTLSDRLVEAQRPIRILDAIKWDDAIEAAFFAKDAKELPPVTPEYYVRRPLPFDPDRKREEFQTLERDIRRRLGPYNAAGQIMARMCEEYRGVVDRPALPATRAFSLISERLYGSSSDRFHARHPTP